MNRRLGDYIIPHNERPLYPLVDDKIKTYHLLKERALPQPRHFFHLTTQGDVRELVKRLGSLETFVVKPSRGAMGNGILIVRRIRLDSKGNLIELDTSKGRMSDKAFKQYLSNIISGLYSLDGQPDSAIVQEMLVPHSALAAYCHKGIPDLRIIVFRGYPAMAMMRFPTRLSKGRANLHQGAVGCGINLADGKVRSSVYRDRKIGSHPDTGADFSQLALPQWQESLEMAASCFDITGIGYLGIDIVLDEIKGPLLLEMNARPGLSIQTANMRGLLPTLRDISTQVESVENPLSASERVAFSIKLALNSGDLSKSNRADSAFKRAE